MCGVVCLGFWLGIPGPLGYMEDRDWVDPITVVYTGTLGIISFHDNVLRDAVFADINVGYHILKDNILTITPFLGFNFKHIYMSGRDGYQERPPGTLYASFSGEVITYEQNYYIFYLGIQATWSPLLFLDIQLFACYSPLVFSYNVVIHMPDDEYLDLAAWGHYIYINPAINFRVIENLSLKVHGSFSWVPIFKGASYTKKVYDDEYILFTNSRGGGSLILGGVNLSIILDL